MVLWQEELCDINDSSETLIRRPEFGKNWERQYGSIQHWIVNYDKRNRL